MVKSRKEETLHKHIGQVWRWVETSSGSILQNVGILVMPESAFHFGLSIFILVVILFPTCQIFHIFFAAAASFLLTICYSLVLSTFSAFSICLR